MIPSDKAALEIGSDPGLPALQQEILAALIATDSRPTIVFDPEGRLLLANPVVGAAHVARWHGFGASEAWAEARDRACSAGSAALALDDEAQGELHAVQIESGRAHFYLLRLDEAKGRGFAERMAEMAHDLRAPLQSLIIAADGLASGEGQQGREAEISTLARLALEQIRNLLQTMRMEDVAADSEPQQSFDLVSLVADSARLLEPICRGSGNSLVTELPARPVWVSGAAHLIRAILQNLITNANRFNMNGPVTLRLRSEPTESGRQILVTLEVEDCGPGLTEAERQLILSPGPRGLRRPEARAASRGEGYGLGFGIVSRAVSRLSGRLEVGPGREGRGSLFRIRFPLAASDETAAPSLAPEALISLSGLTVLVVEDNPVNLAILLRSLTDAGAKAEGVLNGTDALARLAAGQDEFDVVLLDVTLPDIDGIEVTRRIRARETGDAPLLIIGLTAHVGSVIHGSGLAAGMDHILIKPVRPSELRAALRDAKDGLRPKQQGTGRMQTPEIMLNNALVAELSEEMGGKATLAFMKQALAEAGTVLGAANAQADLAELRGKIHSAIGSSGLTGLSGVEYGLRQLQLSVRDGECDPAALDQLRDLISKSEERLETFAAGI